mmetsp:Transcript_33288/g.73613  ORF Transcript_33288/g.73613 Transcript_33288/m.73613 type:complete len:270 (+) Transcript_33288:3271-4080(+)
MPLLLYASSRQRWKYSSMSPYASAMAARCSAATRLQVLPSSSTATRTTPRSRSSTTWRCTSAVLGSCQRLRSMDSGTGISGGTTPSRWYMGSSCLGMLLRTLADLADTAAGSAGAGGAAAGVWDMLGEDPFLLILMLGDPSSPPEPSISAISWLDEEVRMGRGASSAKLERTLPAVPDRRALLATPASEPVWEAGAAVVAASVGSAGSACGSCGCDTEWRGERPAESVLPAFLDSSVERFERSENPGIFMSTELLGCCTCKPGTAVLPG